MSKILCVAFRGSAVTGDNATAEHGSWQKDVYFGLCSYVQVLHKNAPNS